MKNLFFIFQLLILTSFAGYAQTNAGLQLRNYNTNNSKFVTEGSKILVIKDGKIYKGTLKVISDESIAINSDTILLSQIQELRVKTFSNQFGGGVLLASGSFVGGFGLVFVGAGIAEASGYGIIAIIFGAPLAAVGIFGAIKGVKLLSGGKKFVPTKWEYKIINTVP